MEEIPRSLAWVESWRQWWLEDRGNSESNFHFFFLVQFSKWYPEPTCTYWCLGLIHIGLDSYQCIGLRMQNVIVYFSWNSFSVKKRIEAWFHNWKGRRSLLLKHGRLSSHVCFYFLWNPTKMLAKNKNLQVKEMGEDIIEIYGGKGAVVLWWKDCKLVKEFANSLKS